MRNAGKAAADDGDDVETVADEGVELSDPVADCAVAEDDRIRRDVIQKLMCDFELDFEALERAHGIRFATLFAPELAALAPLAADGLVELSADRLRITPRGRLLVRAVDLVVV